jgi:hypothetical protein
MWALIAGALIGTVTSALVAIWIEYLRRPFLQLSIETPPIEQARKQGAAAETGRYLRVKLFNKPLPGWVWWMVREPAVNCRAAISFQHLDNQDVFGRTMEGRWAKLPVGRPDTSRIDVYPGDTEVLDVAARFDDHAECYGWNNEAYFPGPYNPDWKLGHGRYVVEVVIRSSGQTRVGLYRLINDVPRSAFRLEPSS